MPSSDAHHLSSPREDPKKRAHATAKRAKKCGSNLGKNGSGVAPLPLLPGNFKEQVELRRERKAAALELIKQSK
jgi:hypothetical protein